MAGSSYVSEDCGDMMISLQRPVTSSMAGLERSIESLVSSPMNPMGGAHVTRQQQRLLGPLVRRFLKTRGMARWHQMRQQHWSAKGSDCSRGSWVFTKVTNSEVKWLKDFWERVGLGSSSMTNPHGWGKTHQGMAWTDSGLRLLLLQKLLGFAGCAAPGVFLYF